jgi:hypothetical protein
MQTIQLNVKILTIFKFFFREEIYEFNLRLSNLEVYYGNCCGYIWTDGILLYF